MKKTIIGAVMLIAGVLQTIGIIISGVIYLPHQSEWSTAYSSILWFLIMAAGVGYNLFHGLDDLSKHLA